MEEKILLSHGSGGKLTHRLINDLILKFFKNPILEELGDSAVFGINNTKLAYTTDAYVIEPIFFPGGDIGKLAVCGTVNDLSMQGAIPLYLSASLIIEEGFPIAELEKILKSMKEAADEAACQIITGDIKVVQRGAADKIFIITSGIGLIKENIKISPTEIKLNDQIIISGSIGEHGLAVLGARQEFNFNFSIQSDVAPLNHLVAKMIKIAGGKIHALRDPTRGGVATVLNELAQVSKMAIRIYEDKIPIREEVKGFCELLGFDPLYIANEGKLIAVVDYTAKDAILECMKEDQYGRDAQIIGEVIKEPAGKVLLKTTIGGTRIVDMLTGEQLPRIC